MLWAMLVTCVMFLFPSHHRDRLVLLGRGTQQAALQRHGVRSLFMSLFHESRWASNMVSRSQPRPRIHFVHAARSGNHQWSVWLYVPILLPLVRELLLRRMEHRIGIQFAASVAMSPSTSSFLVLVSLLLMFSRWKLSTIS